MKRVLLTGGLGNQLFQLAAALFLSEGNNEKILLDSSYGSPRRNKEELPELTSFIIPDQVRYQSDLKYRFFAGKLINLSIRVSTTDKKNFLLPMVIQVIFNILGYLRYHKLGRIFISSGVGFDDRLSKSANKHFFVGYFQCFNWAENNNVFDQLMKIEMVSPGPQLLELKSLSIQELPLIIHMRFGDYLNAPSFGVLDKSYYSNSIEKMMGKQAIRKIWLFSDDVDLAVRQIPEAYRALLRVIPEVDNSTTATFEAMRLGSAYIIANSTFSWWAAYLRHERLSPVIAPKPWFRGSISPTNLIPESWIQVDAWKL